MKVLEQAIKLSYPKLPKSERWKYSYSKGKPTKAFKEALNKAYPKRKWSTPAKKGASCDVAVGTVVRSSGVDKKFPRGRSEQRKYKSDKFTRIVKKNAKPIDYAKKGDIVMYDRTKGGKKGHIFIFAGDRIYEASNGKKYFHCNSSLKKMRKKYKKVIILREK